MNSADRSELLRALQERSDTIADSWYRAIARSSYIPHSAAEVRQRIAGLTEQAIALLLTDPLEHGQAEAIGASLARLHCIEPEVLGRTQELLARLLVQGLPADQAVALQPQLAVLLGGLAAGFFQQAREVILAEQEQIQGAVISDLQRSEEAQRRYSERLKTLHELDQAILAARSPEAIAQAALHYVRRLVPCPGSAVTVFDLATGEATVLVAQVNGEPVVETRTRLSLEEFKGAKEFIESLLQGEVHVVDDILAIPQPPPVLRTLQAEGLRSLLNVPLVAEDELIGFLSLGLGNPGPCAPEHVDIACEVAGQLAIAIQQARLFGLVRAGRERLRRLARQIVSTQEEERRRLSRALHDEAGQALTALKISLELIQEDLPVELGSLRQRIGEAAALTTTTMEQIRLLALDLRPPALDAVGLGPTLEGFCRDFARRTQLSIDFLGLELPMLPEEANTCLYRFLQEALTNVAKHACASQVRVALQCDSETVSLSVEDDGRGFDRQARLSVSGWPMGIGLLGMRERLESLGGHLEIKSQLDQGTRLVAYLPAGGTP